MAGFLFCDAADPGVRQRTREAAAASWGALNERSAGAFCLFSPARDAAWALAETPAALGAVAGYARTDDAPGGDGAAADPVHHGLLLDELIREGGWPLSGSWTGSFGAVAHAKAGPSTVLAGDVIGFHPVYYATVPGGLVGGTSLIALSRCVACNVDVFGLVQQTFPPFCNYGRRTLLTGVSRLLPGERLVYDRARGSQASGFDDSLCGGVEEGPIGEIARRTWEMLAREISLAAGPPGRTSVALSGGWDSRLLLAPLARRGGAIACYTYGDEDAYETRIARRLARSVGARHEVFPIRNHYFPPREQFLRLVRETEALKIPDWYSMILALRARTSPSDVLLIGDHCQGVDARYIADLSSRQARKRSYLLGLVGLEPEPSPASADLWRRWREAKTEHVVSEIRKSFSRLAPQVAGGVTEAAAAEAARADLETSFRRIEATLPPFAPMFDELFLWLHKSRYTLASQNLLLDALFRALSPTMSLRALRAVSRIHPRLRLRRRLMDAIAGLSDFDDLARIPSSQIPWIGARAPSHLREAVWGIRSEADRLLTARALRRKDAEGRQWVLKSLDYLTEYRREATLSTVRSWFSGRWLRPEPYERIAAGRADLSTWPLINVDITAPANASLILDECRLG